MKCKNCGSEELYVIDTRKYDDCVIRIRMCQRCRHIHRTTEELIDVKTQPAPATRKPPATRSRKPRKVETQVQGAEDYGISVTA